MDKIAPRVTSCHEEPFRQIAVENRFGPVTPGTVVTASIYMKVYNTESFFKVLHLLSSSAKLL